MVESRGDYMAMGRAAHRPSATVDAREVANRAHRKLVAVVLGLLLAMTATGAHAQPAGQAVAVSGSVSASGEAGVRALVAGSPVFMGDTIDTGAFGEAQIVFSDATRLAVGPGSRVVLDAYVVQTRTTASRFAINAARGAIRFISGGSRSNAYQVTTPTATIGIRGTAFDVSTRTAQRTNALLYDGRISACSVAGGCADLDRSCEVAVILADPARPVLRSDTRDLVPGATRFQFPYLVDEQRLLPEFRVQADRCLGNGGRRSQPAQDGRDDRQRERGEPETPGNGDDGESGDGDYGKGDSVNGETGDGHPGGSETGSGGDGRGDYGGSF